VPSRVHFNQVAQARPATMAHCLFHVEQDRPFGAGRGLQSGSEFGRVRPVNAGVVVGRLDEGGGEPRAGCAGCCSDKRLEKIRLHFHRARAYSKLANKRRIFARRTKCP